MNISCGTAAFRVAADNRGGSRLTIAPVQNDENVTSVSDLDDCSKGT
jgi:hypothetical protein